MKNHFIFLNINFIICLIALFSISVFSNWGGGADKGSYGSGNFKAIGTKNVEIVYEDLTINLYKDRAKVSVEYILKNTGKTSTIKAGFPCIAFEKRYEIENYRIKADNKKLKYKTVSGKMFREKTIGDHYLPDESLFTNKKYKNTKAKAYSPIYFWFVSKIKMKKGEKKNIKITYDSIYNSKIGGVSDDTDYERDQFRYLLSTGSVWKGPIKKGKITIKGIMIDPADITIKKPKNRFTRQGNVFSWEFTNLEPNKSHDILLLINKKMKTRTMVKVIDSMSANYEYDWYVISGKDYFFDTQRFNIKASSTLKDKKHSYHVGNIRDTKKWTSWVEGKKGSGIGESISIKLDEPMKVDYIGIIPGFAKNKTLYYLNNRIKKLTIIVNGKHKIKRKLPDDCYTIFRTSNPKSYYYIPLGKYKGKAKTIKIIIDAVYKGWKYNDTCISEVILRKNLENKPRFRGAR